MDLNFSIEKFYVLGIICFSIVVLGSVYSIYNHWNYSDIGIKVSSIATTIFDVGLIALFNHLRKHYGTKGLLVGKTTGQPPIKLQPKRVFRFLRRKTVYLKGN